MINKNYLILQDKKNLLLRRDFEAFKLKYQLWQDYQNRPEDTDVI